MADPVLRLTDVHMRFGSLAVLADVDLIVAGGERRALIGPNGAGKTTLFSLIGGSLRPTSGHIELEGRDVTRQPEWSRTRAGLSKTFQRSSLFLGMNARENVDLAVQRHLGVATRRTRRRDRFPQVRHRTDELLATVGLEARGNTAAGELSHGEQRQLEIALALALSPRVLLLDEPVAGMSSTERHRFVELVHGLPAELTIVLIEHDIGVVFELAQRISVLAAGRIIADGDPDQIRGSAAVQEAYLGDARRGWGDRG